MYSDLYLEIISMCFTGNIEIHVTRSYENNTSVHFVSILRWLLKDPEQPPWYLVVAKGFIFLLKNAHSFILSLFEYEL